MKICIVGTYCSGKTTLAKALADRLCIHFPCRDNAQKIGEDLDKRKRFNELSIPELWELQKRFLTSTQKVHQYNSFVTDASTITWVPYCNYFIGKDYLSTISDYSDYLKTAYHEMKLFDFIFYLPLEIPFEDDGFRPCDPEIRTVLDQLIQEELKHLPHYTLTGSVSDRIQQVLSIINI